MLTTDMKNEVLEVLQSIRGLNQKDLELTLLAVQLLLARSELDDSPPEQKPA